MISGTALAIILIPVFAIAAGMWFGRKAPHRPEYDNVEAYAAKAAREAQRPA